VSQNIGFFCGMVLYLKPKKEVFWINNRAVGIQLIMLNNMFRIFGFFYRSNTAALSFSNL